MVGEVLFQFLDEGAGTDLKLVGQLRQVVKIGLCHQHLLENRIGP